MKNIKIAATLILMLIAFTTNAQETSTELFSVPLSNPNSSGKLIIQQISGSIDVVGYDGKEVIVKASFGNKKAHYKDDKEKDGLKRIENNSLKITAEEKDNVVQIINEQFNKVTNLEIKVPKNFSLKLSTINNGNITVNGVNGEFEVSNINGEITMKNVSGSASVDTINGDIIVEFNSITNDANMAFSSLNGDLNVTFPSSLKANIKAKSDMGEIYTDFDMVVDKQKPEVNTDITSNTYKVKIEQWVRGKINGGGPEMFFKSFNGDIMIRSN